MFTHPDIWSHADTEQYIRNDDLKKWAKDYFGFLAFPALAIVCLLFYVILSRLIVALVMSNLLDACLTGEQVNKMITVVWAVIHITSFITATIALSLAWCMPKV